MMPALYRRKYTSFYKIVSCFSLFLSFVVAVDGQSTETLTPDAFINQVKQYHPIARQANISVERAAAALTAAKGNFDPVVEMDFDNKEFAGIEYYRYSNAELKLPTLTGITIKSGFENATGKYANPELTNGTASYIGLEVPLLKGLLIDKQRAVLKQAKLFTTQTAQEQASTINELLFNAYNVYWQWAGAYQLYNLYSGYLQVAQKRMALVRVAFNNGDRSQGDTIEAFSQLQNIMLLRNDAAIQLNTVRYDLSAFLWNEQLTPYVLDDKYRPDTISFREVKMLPQVDLLEIAMQAGHPALQVYERKRQMLMIDRQLKLQNLLPAFNVKANLLSKNYYDKLSIDGAYLRNNYKFGFTLKMPLLLRQARGEYRQANLKLRENSLLQSLKAWELSNKLKKYYNEASLYSRQLQTVQDIKASYTSLLKIEELKFTQGESSLFMVNSRENKLLEAEQKLLELHVKYLKAILAVQWAQGVLK